MCSVGVHDPQRKTPWKFGLQRKHVWVEAELMLDFGMRRKLADIAYFGDEAAIRDQAKLDRVHHFRRDVRVVEIQGAIRAGERGC
jgi:hypothetical protein